MKNGGEAQSAVIAVGDAQPPRIHALAHAINAAIGADKQCVEFRTAPTGWPGLERGTSETPGLPSQAQSSPGHPASIHSLVADMAAGNVSTLFILGGNPVFDAPSDLEFAAALKQVAATNGTVVMLLGAQLGL